MNTIKKTIQRKYTDKNNTLFFLTDRNLMYIIIALFIIFGLETYYKNRFLNDSIYVGGFWTLVYGAWLFLAMLNRRQTFKRLENIHKQHDSNLTESIAFDEDAFKIEVGGVYSNQYDWNLLIGIGETRKHITVKLGNLEIVVVKKHFSVDEITNIQELLRSKIISINKEKLA